jgi:hypothetical protein
MIHTLLPYEVCVCVCVFMCEFVCMMICLRVLYPQGFIVILLRIRGECAYVHHLRVNADH